MTLTLLACWGATQIVCFSHVFHWWRELLRPYDGGLFRCPMCLGFWVGLWLSFATGKPLLEMFLTACASSAVSYFGCMIVGDGGLRIVTRDGSRNHPPG